MSLLDLLGLNRIFKAGTEVKPTRKILNFIGDGVTVVDDEANQRTNITIAAGGGAGDVTGPGSSVAGRVAVFSGTTGKVIADGGALLADLATETYVDDAIAAIPGGGDVVGPNMAINNRIAVFDGTTGDLIKDGGQTIAQVIAAATDAEWKKALDIDFTVLANQTITTGAVAIGGVTWTAVDIATYSSVFEILNGTGLRMKGNAANSGMYNTFRTLAHLKVKVQDLIPLFSLKTKLRLAVSLDTIGTANGAEVVGVSLGSWTHNATDASMARVVHGNVGAGAQRRVDGWRTSHASLVDFDNAKVPSGNRQMIIQLDSIPDWKGSFLSSPYTVASPVVWNDPKAFVSAREFDFQYKINASIAAPSAGFLSDTNRPAGTVLQTPDEMALMIAVGTGNTNNNTSFEARVQAIKLEYQL